MAYPPQIPLLYKDPSATLDFGFDLASVNKLIPPWLAPGEIVTSVTVTADTGITAAAGTIGPNSAGIAGSLLLSMISGNTLGTYLVHFLFTTNQGRTDTRSIQIIVAQR
jgi:hypothetical protein